VFVERFGKGTKRWVWDERETRCYLINPTRQVVLGRQNEFRRSWMVVTVLPRSDGDESAHTMRADRRHWRKLSKAGKHAPKSRSRRR
jgi:hypothetical protein